MERFVRRFDANCPFVMARPGSMDPKQYRMERRQREKKKMKIGEKRDLSVPTGTFAGDDKKKKLEIGEKEIEFRSAWTRVNYISDHDDLLFSSSAFLSACLAFGNQDQDED